MGSSGLGLRGSPKNFGVFGLTVRLAHARIHIIICENYALLISPNLIQFCRNSLESLNWVRKSPSGISGLRRTYGVPGACANMKFVCLQYVRSYTCLILMNLAQGHIWDWVYIGT
uniref:Uncharacterized protein n=1 Tax=Cacopsylla melanoneura TaxID=428564 RepID=A0A8D9ABJ7_9HEMI